MRRRSRHAGPLAPRPGLDEFKHYVWSAVLSGRFKTLAEDVVATVGVSLRERREGLLDVLLAAAAEQTDRHGCPECVDAIAV